MNIKHTINQLSRMTGFPLVVIFATLADAKPPDQADDSAITSQAAWYERMDDFSGKWNSLDGAWNAVLDGSRFSLKSGGSWPELESNLLLSPQIDFFAGGRMYELWLGDYPAQWMLLLRYPDLKGNRLEVPEYRVFERVGKLEEVEKRKLELASDLTIGWRLRLLMASGNWKSIDGDEMVVNYRSISFNSSTSWPQLKNLNYLEGSTCSFIVDDFRFDIKYPDQSREEIWIFRKNILDSSLQSKKYFRVND